MIAVGETYRPSGAFELRPILVTLILGSATAAVCGLVIWLWEISPIPTLVIITPILQGVVIGLAFHFMIGRLHMRMPWVAGAIAFACGLFTIGLVHYGHHLWVMRQAASEIRTEIAADNELGPQQKQALLADLDQNPNRFVNRVLRGITGHEGFLGTLIIRNKQGVYIRNAQVSGWFLWGLWGAEALFVSIVAASMASSRAAEPYCEPCASWCAKGPQLLRLPLAQAQQVMAALRTDHLAELNALRDQPAPGPTEGSVSVLLRSCPHCDVSFADVSSRTFTAKDKAQEKTLLKHLAVSPQMAALLRNSLPTVDTGQPAPTAAVSERPENEAPPEPEPA